MDAFDKLAKELAKTTQLEFSERTGIPQSQLSMLKNKKRRPSLQHVPALNFELGTTLEDWLSAELEPKPKPRKRRVARKAA